LVAKEELEWTGKKCMETTTAQGFSRLRTQMKFFAQLRYVKWGIHQNKETQRKKQFKKNYLPNVPKQTSF
jgi:hypothetical protein